MNATQNLRTEASLYADGTSHTADELVAAYEAYVADCEAKGTEPATCERFFAENYGEEAIETTIEGKRIQHDNSGVGHNWRTIDADDLPANIAEEIAAEIIDGGKDECSDYVASNGLHYRWA